MESALTTNNNSLCSDRLTIQKFFSWEVKEITFIFIIAYYPIIRTA